jgi:hypothetical protein
MDSVKGELVATNGKPAPELVPLPPAPPSSVGDSYMQGFDGMAIARFPKEVEAILRAPIDPEQVEIKPDGICYLPGVFYRRRLMDAFGPGGWALAARRPPQTRSSGGGELVVFFGALYAMGRFVGEAGGQCTYFNSNKGMTFADALEGAKTDCITRCCKDLGIAWELWDPGWRGQWQAKYARQVMKRVKVWDPRAKEEVWKDKEVWERKPHGQKLASPSSSAAAAPTAAETSPSSPAGTASVSGADSSTETSPPSDTGEAPDDGAIDQLRAAVKAAGWKAQFVKTWFTNRFGIWPPESLTKLQLETAHYLLAAWREPDGGDIYKAALVKAQAEGRCR